MAKMNDNRVSADVRNRAKSYEARKAAHEHSIAKKKRAQAITAWSISAVVVIALGIGVYSAITSLVSPSASPVPTETSASAPDPALSENRVWIGTMNVAGVPLSFELDGEAAPQAVASTVSLVNSGFYEGISCHRLTTEGIYVLQCGDPNGDGSGGPGYTYGPVENAPADDVYPAGTIAMARQSGNGSSMGSQFFIVYEDSIIPSDAAGGYTVIGHITSGLPELISSVTSQGTEDESGDGRPKTPVTITSISLQ